MELTIAIDIQYNVSGILKSCEVTVYVVGYAHFNLTGWLK